MGSPTVHCVTPSEYRAHGIKLTWLSANLLTNPRFPHTTHRAETLCDILLAPPETPYHKSQPLFQKYKSILPTSLTYIVLIGQRLLTLETCCGFWYGYDQESQMTHSISILFTHRSIVQTQMHLPFQLLYFPISVLHNSREVTSPQLQPKLEPWDQSLLERKADSSTTTETLRQLNAALQLHVDAETPTSSWSQFRNFSLIPFPVYHSGSRATIRSYPNS